MYANNRQFQSVANLKHAILPAWDFLNENLLQYLVSLMDTKLFQVIQRNSGPTD